MTAQGHVGDARGNGGAVSDKDIEGHEWGERQPLVHQRGQPVNAVGGNGPMGQHQRIDINQGMGEFIVLGCGFSQHVVGHQISNVLSADPALLEIGT